MSDTGGQYPGQPGQYGVAYPQTQPEWAQPGQPQWAYGAPPQPHSGWTPPPKPGLIPLRPLSFGTIFGAPYQLLRRNPKAMFGTGLLIQGAIAVLTVAATTPALLMLYSRVETASPSDAGAVTAGAITATILLVIGAALVSTFGTAMLQGVIVLEAARQSVGETLTFGQLWKRVGRRIWPLAGWLLLLAAGFIVAIAAVVLMIVALSMLGPAFIALPIVLGILAAIGLTVLYAWISTKTAFVPCAIVLEGRGLFASVARSWTLVRGGFWKIFGINLLVAFIVSAAAQLIATPVVLLLTFAQFTIDPNRALDPVAVSLVTNLASIVITMIVGAIGAVLQSGTLALLYIDRRMRTEALDIALQSYVTARDAGLAAADPYLASPAA